MMLAASSPFFASALTSKFKEGAEKTIKLDPDLSVRCVEALLRFAHAGASESIRVPATELESLVVAADQLGFTGVLPLAAERLRQTLTPSNCIDRLILSERHGLPTLARGCVEVIGKEFEGMQQSLSSLSQGCLVVLLSHEPAVMPEDRIFELLLAWLQEDPKNRQELFPNLLELVRLPSLGIDYLSENVMYAPSVLGSSKAQELVRSEAEMLALETTVGGLAACLPRVLVLGQQRRGDVAVDATGAAHGGRPKTTFSHRSPGVVSMTIPPPLRSNESYASVQA